MDPAALTATIRNAVFRSTQFRQGYDEGAVDQLLDELERAVASGASGEEVAALARNAQVPMTSMRRGYDYADVDTFLDEVVAAATGEAATPSSSAPAAAPAASAGPTAAPAPDASRPTGFGARLVRLLRGE